VREKWRHNGGHREDESAAALRPNPAARGSLGEPEWMGGRGERGGEGHGNAGAAFLYRCAEVHDVPVGWHHAAGEDLGRNVPAPRRATPGRWTWVGGTARPRTTCVKQGRGEG
jgi:hypothetical protein